jgi:DNA-binding LacI/PurR family transcriptional regulator
VKRVGLLAELTGPANLEPLVHAACVRLESVGIETIAVSSGYSQKSELSSWDVLARHNCDAYIVHSDTLSNDQLARLKSLRKNTVLAHIDYKMAGKLAASVIAKLGHRDIAMVTGQTERFSVKQRCEGFMQQLQVSTSNRITVKTVNTSEISFQSGRRIMQSLLEADPKPTAVFFHYEDLAAGAAQMCKENNLQVPDDISLLTCSEQTQISTQKPSLCMVRQPLQAIGKLAANKVLSLLDQSPSVLYPASSSWPTPYIKFHNSLKENTSRAAKTQPPAPGISEREKQCLQWAAKGKTSWEISQILGVTESTIIYHLRNATRKLDAANRLHAVTKALQASIIDF